LDLKKILADRQIWQKKAQMGGFAYPYSPPLCIAVGSMSQAKVQKDVMDQDAFKVKGHTGNLK